MGCSTRSVKISSIILNAILAIFGFAAFIWIIVNKETQSKEAVIVAYVACSLIILFAFLGIYAAVSESVPLAAVCAVFLLIVAILQIVSTCIGLQERAESDSGLNFVDKAWLNDGMHDLQQRFECCGRISPQDYVLLNRPIPTSCYEELKEEPEYLYLDGCIAKIQNYYESERGRFIIVSWLLIIFELLCFMLAVYLVISIRNKRRRMEC